MTPLEINILLHFYAIAEPWPRIYAPACKEVLDDFLVNGLVELHADSGSGYRTTERGTALVDHLCAVQYPVAQWVQPSAHPTPSTGE